MFVTIMCKCENGHEWQMLLPKYYFAIENCCCSECDMPVVSMKAGGPVTIDQVRDANTKDDQ
jgi:hypothetical protein